MVVWLQPVQRTAGWSEALRWLRTLGIAYYHCCAESRFEKDMKTEGGYLQRGRELEGDGGGVGTREDNR